MRLLPRARAALVLALALASVGAIARPCRAQEPLPAPSPAAPRRSVDELREDYRKAIEEYTRAESSRRWYDHVIEENERQLKPYRDEARRIAGQLGQNHPKAKEAQDAVLAKVIELKQGQYTTEQPKAVEAEEAARRKVIAIGWSYFQALSDKVKQMDEAAGPKREEQKQQLLQDSIDVLRLVDGLEKLPITSVAPFVPGATDERDPYKLDEEIDLLEQESGKLQRLVVDLDEQVANKCAEERHLSKYLKTPAMMQGRVQEMLEPVKQRIAQLEQASSAAHARATAMRAEIERLQAKKKQLEDGISRGNDSTPPAK